MEAQPSARWVGPGAGTWSSTHHRQGRHGGRHSLPTPFHSPVSSYPVLQRSVSGFNRRLDNFAVSASEPEIKKLDSRH